MNDAQHKKLGIRLIELLGLRIKSNERVDTVDGDKTHIGLSKTICKEIDDRRGYDAEHIVLMTAAELCGVTHCQMDDATLRIAKRLVNSGIGHWSNQREFHLGPTK